MKNKLYILEYGYEELPNYVYVQNNALTFSLSEARRIAKSKLSNTETNYYIIYEILYDEGDMSEEERIHIERHLDDFDGDWYRWKSYDTIIEYFGNYGFQETKEAYESASAEYIGE